MIRRRTRIKVDPEKVRAWQQRSRKRIERRTAVRKKAKRKEQWVVEKGVRIFLKSGREQCITEAAWRSRTAVVFRRDEGLCRCRCKKTCMEGCRACGCGEQIMPLDFHCDHIVKRSVLRDDRTKNLRATKSSHHQERHGQGWSKGELQWQAKN